MTRIPVRDLAHWHELRRTRIGSSDQPALWGVSPYKTLYQLWHEKRGTLAEEDLSDNKRVVFGKHLEAGIANAMADLFHLRIRKADAYVEHPRLPGMGASLDFEIWCHPDGAAVSDERPATHASLLVPFEIKNVDYLVWRDQWLHEGHGATAEHEPPEHIDIQVQHQIACTGAPFAFVGVLVGGNTPHLVRRERHPGVVAAVERKVTAFWDSIAAGAEPSPDYGRDLQAMERTMLSIDADAIDMRGDSRFEALMAEYAEAKAIENDAGLRADVCRAEALDLMQGAQRVITNGGSIAAPLRPAVPAKTVEYAAKPERREVRFYPKKRRSNPDGSEAESLAAAA
jgi:putative phage-type endonuclease